MWMRNTLSMGVSMCALLSPAAVAQSDTAKPQETNSIPVPDVSTPVSGIGDIIVTARRRAERLQDVPVSVTAFNSESLTRAGIERTENLQLSTPTLRIAPQSNGRATPVFELRGINSFDVLATQDPAVAVYVDEVYQARPVGLNQPLLDVESVQVLLGPQGTLFGRNSTAGAILFASKRPTELLGGELATRIGNYGRIDVSAILNVPVSDTLSVRLAGQRIRRNGYTTDVLSGRRYDDENSYNARASILWKPTATLENYTVADYYKSDENGTSNVLYAIRPTGAASTVFPNFPTLFAQQKERGPRRIAINQFLYSRAKAYGVANTTTLDLSDTLVLKNIFGYRNVRAANSIDIDGTIAPSLEVQILNTGKQFSDELQLQGKVLGGNLNYIAGIYYFWEKTNYQASATNRASLSSAAIPNRTNTFGTNESYSFFAQGTYSFPTIEGLSFTAGGRYSWDNRKAVYDNPTNGPLFTCGLVGLPMGGPCFREVSANFSAPSWTFSLDYQIAQGKLIYIAHRRGYRSGGFNTRASTIAQAQPFRPETVSDIEVGVKADWDLGDEARLRTNFAAYTNNYDDIQRNVSSLVGTPPVITTTIINAAKAKIKGFEANVTFEPVHELSLNGFWGYVDAVHKTFDLVPTAGAVGSVCGDQLIGPADVGKTFSCTNVPFGVAKNTIGGSITLTPIKDDRGTLSATVNVFRSDSIRGTQQLPLFDREATIPAYTNVNAVMTWDEILSSTLSVDLYMNNVFNKAYAVSIQSQQASFGLSSVTYNEPRMYGIRVKYAFGK